MNLEISWKSGFRTGAVLGFAIVAFNFLVFFLILFYLGTLEIVADLTMLDTLVLSMVSSLFFNSIMYGVIGAVYSKVEKRIPVKKAQLKSTIYFLIVLGPIAIFSNLTGLSLWNAVGSIPLEAGNFVVKAAIWSLAFPLLSVFFNKKTTSNKTYSIDELASVKRRTAAFLIDFIVTLLIIDLLLVLLYIGTYGLQDVSYERVYYIAKAYSVFLLVPIPLIYWTLLEGFFGQTVGKKIFGLRVIGKNGEKVGLLAAAIRNFPKYILLSDLKTVSLLVFDSLGFIPTKRKQKFTDILVDTQVVKVKK